MNAVALFLDIGPGDELRIGDGAVLTLEHKSGRRARLRITGEADVKLVRDARIDPAPVKQAEVTSGRRT